MQPGLTKAPGHLGIGTLVCVELRHSRLAQWMWSAPPSARIMDVEGIMLIHCIEYNGIVRHIVERQCSALSPLLVDMKAVLFMVLVLRYK
jgi:hypothetical protein